MLIGIAFPESDMFSVFCRVISYGIRGPAVYDGTCISHTPGAVFQAQSLDNQDGANTRTIRLRKALSANSNIDLFGAGLTFPTAVEMSTMIHTVVHSSSARCTIFFSFFFFFFFHPPADG